MDYLLRRIVLVIGVFTGTYIWWGTLTAVTHIIKKKTAKFSFRYMNRIFGSIHIIMNKKVLIISTSPRKNGALCHSR